MQGVSSWGKDRYSEEVRWTSPPRDWPWEVEGNLLRSPLGCGLWSIGELVQEVDQEHVSPKAEGLDSEGSAAVSLPPSLHLSQALVDIPAWSEPSTRARRGFLWPVLGYSTHGLSSPGYPPLANFGSSCSCFIEGRGVSAHKEEVLRLGCL